MAILTEGKTLKQMKPRGPQNTNLNHGINQVKFNWYCAGVGWCVASIFWGACFHLWGA